MLLSIIRNSESRGRLSCRGDGPNIYFLNSLYWPLDLCVLLFTEKWGLVQLEMEHIKATSNTPIPVCTDTAIMQTMSATTCKLCKDIEISLGLPFHILILIFELEKKTL